MEGHIDAVRVLTSLGPDSDMVFSGSYDGSIGFFHIPRQAEEWPAVASQPRATMRGPSNAPPC